MPATTKSSSKKMSDYIYAVGRRKTATARIRLYRKSGDNLVNGIPFGKYFPGEVSRMRLEEPFKLTSSQDKFHYSIKVAGSGKNAQLEAVIHGLARALVKIDVESNKPPLRKAGLLTRDPRMRESRKVGTGGKARRAKQSPKR